MARPVKDAHYMAGPVRVTGSEGRHRILWTEDGSQSERTAMTLELAIARADSEAARIAAGRHDHTAASVNDLIKAYLTPDTRPGWEDGTRATAKSVLEVHVGERFGKQLVGTLTPQQLAKIAPELASKGHPYNTINSILKNTRALVCWAAGEGVWQSEQLLAALAMPAKIRPKVVPRALRTGPKYSVPTDGQVYRFAQALGDHYDPYGLMARLTYDTAVRFGEVSALDILDIDLRAGELTVDKAFAEVNGVLELKAHKTEAGSRIVPISDEELLEDLAEYIANHRGGTLLFHTMRGVPRPIRRSNFRNRFVEPARNVSGLPEHLTWHSLRHGGISAWVNAGIPVADVSRMAGHSSANFTLDTYYGANQDHVRNAAKLMRAYRAGLCDNDDDEG